MSPPPMSVSFSTTPSGSPPQLCGGGGGGGGGGAGAGGSSGEAERAWQLEILVRVPVQVNMLTSSAWREPWTSAEELFHRFFCCHGSFERSSAGQSHFHIQFAHS
eukprot:SAG11_NODE_1994_length_3953_cov_2.436430_3_plen_105_part_00